MTEQEFVDRYLEIRERLNAESLSESLWWPNADWSKMIYGSHDKKTIELIHELTAAMEDTGEWIVKTLFEDYPDGKRIVKFKDSDETEQWKIDFPSQLFAFLTRKRDLLISDSQVKFVDEQVKEGRNRMAIEFCWDEESSVWIAVSPDIPGLALESDSLDALVEKVKEAVSELTKLNSCNQTGLELPVLWAYIP